jgi:hypothetical protein
MYNLYYRSSTNSGRNWTDEIIINRNMGQPYQNDAGFKYPFGDYGDMLVDRSGLVHIVWGEGDNGLGDTYYSHLKPGTKDSPFQFWVLAACAMGLFCMAGTGFYWYRQSMKYSDYDKESFPDYEPLREEELDIQVDY